MRYIKLGTTGLDVSPVAIGAMTYGDPGRGHPAWSLDEAASRPLIKHALDAGINFFDTANMYSYGSSEEILGRALNDFADRNDHATPLEETLEALHDLVKAGKVRYLGASSMHAWEFAKALHLQRQHGWARFVSMQDHYNLLAREEEREMIPLCLDEGAATVVWSPLARGRLARPWEAAKSTTRAETDGGYADLLYSALTADSDHAIIDAVGAIAAGRGITRAQVALAWLHGKPVVTAPLVGANTTSQIDDAVASLDIELTAGELAALERPYTPRYDFQGVSGEAELQKIRDQIPGYANAKDSSDTAASTAAPISACAPRARWARPTAVSPMTGPSG
jgi:aryl-alcohol dehydrogenase-like predicted oxidoreductase